MKKKKNKPYITSQVKTTANRYITLYPNFKGYKRNGYGPIDTEKWLYNNLMPHLLQKIWFNGDIVDQFDQHWYKIKRQYNEDIHKSKEEYVFRPWDDLISDENNT